MEKIYLSRWFSLGASLLIALSVLLVYSNTFDASFQFDDFNMIVNYEDLHKIENLPKIITTPRGVTLSTFLLNYAYGGTDTTGYHIVNTLIHIVTSILAYFFILKTMEITGIAPARSRRIAVFSALIFAVHPIQTQSVTYIVQRMESLASLFYLLSLLLFAYAATTESAVKRAFLYAGVALSYLLGFYSKEVAFTIPVIIFLYDLYFVSNLELKGVLKRWPIYSLLGALFIIFTVNTLMPMGVGDLSKEASVNEAATSVESGVKHPVIEDSSPQKEESAGFRVSYYSPKEYLYTQFNVLIYYITLLVYPANQTLDYDFPISKDLFSVPEAHPGTALNVPIPPPALSLFLLFCIAIIAFYLLFRSWKNPEPFGRIASFFILWFFIILAPTSSFMPIIDVIYEHRVYLASLGFFTIFVIMVEKLTARLSR